MRLLRFLFVCGLLSSMSLLSGCGDMELKDEQSIYFSRQVRSIDLTGFNGSIEFHPLTDGQPRVVVERSVRSFSGIDLEDQLRRIEINNVGGASSLILQARLPEGTVFGTSYSVRYRVYMEPSQIESLRAHTSNGPIVVNGAVGEVFFRTSNGPIVMNESTGVFDVRTSNGPITLNNISFTNSSNVRTSNAPIQGNVSFSVASSRPTYRLETSNAAVQLRVPAGTEGEFTLSTSNADAVVRFGELDLVGRSLSFVQGSNRASVQISTSNAPIRLEGPAFWAK